ncbi:hypothetical protein L6304_03155, partial [bacterium]|nr:hypothetical protein [bacterium]
MGKWAGEKEMKLNELTAYEISKLIRKGEVSSEEVTRSVFERIEKVEKKIGSFITLMKETKGAANPQLVNKLFK